jgi:hypothetical protein
MIAECLHDRLSRDAVKVALPMICHRDEVSGCTVVQKYVGVNGHISGSSDLLTFNYEAQTWNNSSTHLTR